MRLPDCRSTAAAVALSMFAMTLPAAADSVTVNVRNASQVHSIVSIYVSSDDSENGQDFVHDLLEGRTIPIGDSVMFPLGPSSVSPSCSYEIQIIFSGHFESQSFHYRQWFSSCGGVVDIAADTLQPQPDNDRPFVIEEPCVYIRGHCR